MENEKRLFTEEAQAQLKRHKAMIEKLQRDNDQMKEELSLVTREGDVLKNGKTSMTVLAAKSVQSAMQTTEEIRAVRDRVEEEKAMQEGLEEEIKEIQQEIIDQKRRYKGINGAADRNSQITKQIKILESRLEKANQKFNEAVNSNKTLREQIDSLRRERVIFENVYRRLESDLQKKRKDMANIIEIANTAYEERDKAQERLALLIKRAEREQALELH